MVTKTQTVRLVDRTMSAIRGNESLSARLNQIVDRYLEMLISDSEAVRGKFTPTEWMALVSAWDRRANHITQAIATKPEMMRNVVSNPQLQVLLSRMSSAEWMILVELLEAGAD